jgi:hypothetical protein
MVFRYAQPILISVTIGFVRKRSSQDEDIDSGYWLVVLTALIYCGLAVIFPKSPSQNTVSNETLV